MTKFLPVTLAALAAGGMVIATPALAQYRQTISNDIAKCRSGSGPSVLVKVNNVKNSDGTVRVQSYRGTKTDWLAKGKWINRIEAPAKAGTMTFCVPVPASGQYGIAVRHDVNRNGKTDLREDGGGMSNNPSINVFNMGTPSYTKTAFPVGNSVKSININMRYM
ncbi:MAG: DUF2141 domain-containing protein [Sphingomonadaceae bacterium]